MGFSVKPVSEKNIKTIKDGNYADAADLAKLASGEFSSTYDAKDVGFRVRAALEENAPKITPAEDRYSSGDVKSGNPVGDAYWAVNGVINAASKEHDRQNPRPKPQDVTMDIDPKALTAIAEVVKFVRENHNGSNSLHNPNLLAGGDAMSELNGIMRAGNVDITKPMTRDEALLVSDAAIALKKPGQKSYDLLDDRKVPVKMRETAALAAEALAPIRSNALINNVTLAEGPGVEAAEPDGVQAGVQKKVQR